MDWLNSRIRFDRNEVSGAFGDIGTDFPLLVGMILAAGLDAPSVLIVFGAMQVLTGLTYGMPMPVQPLKAMAVIVITQRLTPAVLHAGGLAIGAVMLVLTVSGVLGLVARIVPKSVVRGIQFGLGMQLASLALRDYVTSDGWPGYLLAGAAFVITLLLLGNRRVPPAPLIIVLGVAYAFALKLDSASLAGAVGFSLPKLRTVAWADVVTGFFVLALPQLPLSLGNAILATARVAEDLFPARRVTVRKIGLTYALMNLVSPFLSGVPTCHGSGGITGHFTFGGRTGGSVAIYGAVYLTLGLFFGAGFQTAVNLFPLPVLGVILFFEALALIKLVRDTLTNAADFSIMLLVGVIAFGLPYGYVIGVVIGSLVAYLMPKRLEDAEPGA
jgi:hypothetical protein